MFGPVVIISGFLVVLVASKHFEGDPCQVANGTPGACKFLTNCQAIYQDFLSGKPPEREWLCGTDRFQPIVCCPLNTDTILNPMKFNKPNPTTTRQTTTTTIPLSTRRRDQNQQKPNNNERISKKMCDIYTQSVHTLMAPPTLGVEQKLVNVSLCAIKSEKLIVGGTKADPKEFPHMAAVGFISKSSRKISWLCGGTLVSEKFVLTAAHCSYFSEWGAASWVRVGDLNLERNDEDARVQEKRVIERIRYPEYKKPSQYHDIALLKLESPVKFDAWVRPACLSVSSASLKPKRAIATGWGRVDWTDEKGSDDLLKVVLDLVPNRKCNDVFFGGSYDFSLEHGIIDDWQICAGEEGKDTCQGDSGGPLVVFNTENDCMYDVIGLTSIGRLCGSITPGIYTRVSNYISWLEETIWPQSAISAQQYEYKSRQNFG